MRAFGGVMIAPTWTAAYAFLLFFVVMLAARLPPLISLLSGAKCEPWTF